MLDALQRRAFVHNRHSFTTTYLRTSSTITSYDFYELHDTILLAYMPSFSSTPIMPKELKPSTAQHIPASAFPYSTASTPIQRNAAIWSAADDEILLHARASGLNWQPIASRHFPNKTANACRKRHERLIERRHVEDWDAQKLEALAQEYMACRQQMWELLAARVGERWALVEAKVCLAYQPYPA